MKINLNKENLIGLTALLIHAAKIDENYSNHEKEIIISLIKSISDMDAQKILIDAEKVESDSNQLINFTNILKKSSQETKHMIVEALWKIIISDNSIDQYESNLMRRICGLIYFSDKLSGEIKLKILENIKSSAT